MGPPNESDGTDAFSLPSVAARTLLIRVDEATEITTKTLVV